LTDFLDVLVGGFDCPIHLWAARRRIMMLNFEVLARFRHNFIVQISPINRNELTRKAIATY
jgi:hypothetical protein